VLGTSFSEVTLLPSGLDGMVSPLSRPGSRSNLSCVSPATDMLNRSQRRNYEALLKQITLESDDGGDPTMERRLSASGPAGSPKKIGLLAPPLDEQALIAFFDRVSASIDTMKKEHETFDPALSIASPTGGGGRKGAAATGGIGRPDLSQEELEQLLERINIYKMSRKVEPELPPLSREKLEDCPPPIVPDTTRIKANVTPEAIGCWSPQRRKERIITATQEHNTRESAYKSVREERENEIVLHYSAVLKRKKEQAIKAVRRAKAGTKEGETKDDQAFPADRWLATVAMTSFLNRIREDVKMQKMSDEERMEYIGKHGSTNANSRWATEALEEAKRKQEVLKVLDDPEKVGRLVFLANMIVTKKRVKERKVQAKTLVVALNSWKFFGRAYTCFKLVSSTVVKIQNWWRIKQVQLREVVAKVSHRWERLERHELAKELNKAEPLTARPSRKGSVTAPKLSLEEKIQLELTDEAVRVKFIERELRSRRFRLLPELEIWAHEVVEWRKEREAYHQQYLAHMALGLEAPTTSSFRWPPHVPSYKFGDGTRREEGDADILALWRAARASKGQGGWTAIGKQEVTAGSNQRQAEQKLDTRPFGDADDSELARWGADPAKMPGLTVVHAEGGIRAPPPV